MVAAIERNLSDRIWVIFVTSILILAGIVFAAFLTIFKLKFSDYLQLVPKLTDPVTFCSFTSLFSKVIAVTCFNFMVMTGEVQLKIDQNLGIENEAASYQTSFIKFYSSMIRTPFLGDKYNYLLPGAILIFSLLFLLLSCLRYETALVAMMRRINHAEEQSTSIQDAVEPILKSNQSNDDEESKDGNLKALKKSLNKNEIRKNEKAVKQSRVEIELLLKGEVAFLKEVKNQRDRKKRTKRMGGTKSVADLIAEKKRKMKLNALG